MKPDQLLKLATYFFKSARLDTESVKDLEKYITDENNPEFFISFSDHIKLGLNLRSSWGNPKGIYGKAFTSFVYSALFDPDKDRFSGKPYLTIFKVNNVFNMKDYSESDYISHLEIIKNIYPKIDFTESNLKYIINDFASHRGASNNLPIVKILAITNYLASGKDVEWSILLRRLGFTNLYSKESNEGFIYPQISVLDPSIIEIIETKINPLFDDEISSDAEKSEFNMLEQKKQKRYKEFVNVLKDKRLPSKILRSIYNTNLNKEQLLLFLNHENVPSDILQELASNPDSAIQYCIARHPNSTPETLKIVAENPDLHSYLVTNPNCSSELLTNIFNSTDDVTKSFIIANPNVTTELLIRYLTESQDKIGPFFDAYHMYDENKDILTKVIEGNYSEIAKERAKTILEIVE